MKNTNNLTFLIGSPRSGTSWLGNIFDSHPDVLFRMEPDTVLRGDYPSTFDSGYEAEAASHLEQLLGCRTLKVNGSRPVFRKRYLNPIAFQTRRACIYSFKVAEKVLPIAGNMSVPDFTSFQNTRVVIKSVSMMGRASAWDHFSGAQFVHIIRHPCGHIHSVLRGQKEGHLAGRIPLGFEVCKVAKKYGITREKLEAMDEVERLAWRWAILNEKAIQDLSEGYVQTYEALCADPVGEAKAILTFAGLSWEPQVEAYINDSTSGDGSYFQTRRSPLDAAMSWQKNFDYVNRVISAIGDTKAFELFEVE